MTAARQLRLLVPERYQASNITKSKTRRISNTDLAPGQSTDAGDFHCSGFGSNASHFWTSASNMIGSLNGVVSSRRGNGQRHSPEILWPRRAQFAQLTQH